MGYRRAQSESIGVLLLTVVVIIITTVGGAVVLGGVSDDADRGSAPLVDFGVDITADNVTVTHAGGDAVAQSELTVIVRGETTERYGVDAANASGDGDGQFEPSERLRRDHDVGGSGVEVTVVHDASNTVLARESVTFRGNRPPAARFNASPDDPDPGETVTFDASASDDTDGAIAEYRWAFGDGTTDTTTDPTVEHTYAGEGNYTVTLTVKDDDGATDSATEQVVVSALAVDVSSVAVLDVSDGDGVVGSGASVRVTATVSEPGTGIDTVTTNASSFGAGTQSLSDSDGDGTYEATFNVGSPPDDGPQSVTVTATNTLGTSDSATTGTLTVDTAAPTVESFNVTDQSEFLLVSAVSSYRVNWTVSDRALASARVYLNRTDATDNPQATFSGPSGSETVSQGGGFLEFGGYGQPHEIKLVATDTAGNRRCVVVTDTADGSPDGPIEYTACG